MLLVLAVIAALVIAAGAAALLAGGDGDGDGGKDVASAPETTARAVTASAWEPLEDAELPRQQAPGAELGGKVWVFGGLTGETSARATPTVAAWDTSIDTWDVGPELPDPLHHAMAATYDGRLVVMGGWVPEGSDLDARESARVYVLEGDKWKRLPDMNSPRAAGAAAVVDDKLVVTGGKANGEVLATTEVFDGEEWKVVSDMPTPREHLAAVADDRYFYAVGGREGTSSANLSSLERYDPEEDSWEELAPMPEPLGGLGAALARGTIVAVGGENSTLSLDNVFLYDVARDEWRKGESLPEARHGMTVVAVDDAVYALGGSTEAGHEHSTAASEVLRLDDKGS